MGSPGPGSIADVRVATGADASGIAHTLALAFHDDPLWAWVFPEPAQRYRQLESWWRFTVDNALRYPWTWTTPNYEAVALWIPPGGTELSADAETQVEPLLSGLLSGDPRRVLEILEEFDRAHPTRQPHYYLSLLGTHPDHRGRGIGMALVRDNLERIDAQHGAAYLESSNPANDARYESVGFVRTGQFAAPGSPSVATMWRDPR
jgi:GNAT superfamily N-acetyltransferase